MAPSAKRIPCDRFIPPPTPSLFLPMLRPPPLGSFDGPFMASCPRPWATDLDVGPAAVPARLRIWMFPSPSLNPNTAPDQPRNRSQLPSKTPALALPMLVSLCPHLGPGPTDCSTSTLRARAPYPLRCTAMAILTPLFTPPPLTLSLAPPAPLPPRGAMATWRPRHLCRPLSIPLQSNLVPTLPCPTTVSRATARPGERIGSGLPMGSDGRNVPPAEG